MRFRDAILGQEGQRQRTRAAAGGAHGDPSRPGTLIDGYRPVLLPRTSGDGEPRLAPHNVITTWYWYDVARQRPVTREELETAWFDGDGVAHDILGALDATGDGHIDPVELGLWHPHQVEAVAARLRAAGVQQPEIRAEAQPYLVAHGVVGSKGATRECSTCHGVDSRVGEDFTLADFAPGDVLPTFLRDGGVDVAGTIATSVCGHVVIAPDPELAGVYLLGSVRARWVDRVGLLALLLVVGGVLLHGGLRLVLWSAKRQRVATPPPVPQPEAAR